MAAHRMRCEPILIRLLSWRATVLVSSLDGFGGGRDLERGSTPLPPREAKSQLTDTGADKLRKRPRLIIFTLFCYKTSLADRFGKAMSWDTHLL